jgi:hypothetical protein
MHGFFHGTCMHKYSKIGADTTHKILLQQMVASKYVLSVVVCCNKIFRIWHSNLELKILFYHVVIMFIEFGVLLRVFLNMLQFLFFIHFHRTLLDAHTLFIKKNKQ